MFAQGNFKIGKATMPVGKSTWLAGHRGNRPTGPWILKSIQSNPVISAQARRSGYGKTTLGYVSLF